MPDANVDVSSCELISNLMRTEMFLRYLYLPSAGVFVGSARCTVRSYDCELISICTSFNILLTVEKLYYDLYYIYLLITRLHEKTNKITYTGFQNYSLINRSLLFIDLQQLNVTVERRKWNIYMHVLI